MSPPVEDFEAIRAEAGMPVTRFAALIGVPRRTHQHRLAEHRAGNPPEGPWPAPVAGRIEPTVARLAGEWPAWGHRKIWAMGRHEGWDLGSASSVRRATARRGLLQPVRCQAERRQLAKARRAVFVEAPPRRDQVRRADFSESETAAQGTRQLGGVAGCVTEVALACPISAAQTAGDLCAAFDAAEARAGEQAARPHFAHMRTPHRSPHTNGVIERWSEALKHGRLHRHDTADAIEPAAHAAGCIDGHNRVRPHEHLDRRRPLEAHLEPPTLKPHQPETGQQT